MPAAWKPVRSPTSARVRAASYEPFHFGTSLDADEVEISDEMFVITAEEAKKSIEPPHLAALQVTPGYITIESGKKQTFHGQGARPARSRHRRRPGGLDGYRRHYWRRWRVPRGQDEGNFMVTATVGSVRGTVSVTVRKPGGEPPPPPPPPNDPTRIVWKGEVPAQKWMNFYTKVLSKFAGKGLKLTVQVDFTAEGGISAQKIEEIKLALRELGFRDAVDLI